MDSVGSDREVKEFREIFNRRHGDLVYNLPKNDLKLHFPLDKRNKRFIERTFQFFCAAIY